VDLILIWIIMAAALTALVARFILPAAPRVEAAPEVSAPTTSGWTRVKVLARNSNFIWLMIALGCIQAAHAFYYGFSSLIWKGEGYDGLSIGYLWATGVSTEVLMLAFGLRMRRRFGAWNLLLVAGGFSVLRWAAMAFSPPMWMLWPLQMLHALSFAACYLAGLELTRKFAPEGYQNLAQTISAAYVMGVMMGLATLAAGPVYDVLGARGYGVMALMAAVGFAVALWLYRKHMGQAEPA
ncbi:MAG: MFS transporter, partial [Asticcacaulis sp.]